MFTIRPRDGESQFKRQLADIRREWTGRKVTGLLSVGPEAYFWYYQEFGTATRGGSGEPYIIEATPGKTLTFPHNGSVVHVKAVLHPGIHPARFVSKSLPTILSEGGAALAERFMEMGFTVAAAADAMENVIMPMALDMIVTQLSVDVPGTRPAGEGYPAGKLEGQTAAEVFEGAATLTTTAI